MPQNPPTRRHPKTNQESWPSKEKGRGGEGGGPPKDKAPEKSELTTIQTKCIERDKCAWAKAIRGKNQGGSVSK